MLIKFFYVLQKIRVGIRLIITVIDSKVPLMFKVLLDLVEPKHRLW